MRRTSNLSANLKIIIVLSLLGIWAVPAPLATAQDNTLTGWFTFIVADYPSEDGLVSETTYILTEDSGARHELLIDVALLKPLGGPVALNRKRVTVMGEWEKVGPAVPEKFRVDAIELAASPSTTLQWEPFAADSFPAKPAPLRLAPLPAAESDSHVRGSQAWVTILCRFADATDVTPHPVSHYEKLMATLGHYWKEVSYGNIPDLAGSVVVGWYNLPRPRSYYVYDRGYDGKIDFGDFDPERLEEDCTDVADADVFFPDFDGINLMFNGDIATGGFGGSSFLMKDGEEQFYGIAAMSKDAGISITAHEMGHAFGLPHSSGSYDETYDSAWDVMSRGNGCWSPNPEDGCVDVHTIAYHKDFLGWIPPDRKYVVPRNSTQTITLERLAQPGANGYLMAQIPILDSPTDFYTVEARLFAGYDDMIPGEAVVIHKVDTTRVRQAQVVDIDNNGNPNDRGAMWTVGETFADPGNGLQVSVDAKHATGFQVTIAVYTVCTEVTLPTGSLVRGGAGTASIEVMAPSGCRWATTSNSPWITVQAGSGSGNGEVRYAVAANPSLNARTGTLTIAGRILTVTQAGINDNLFEDDMENGVNGWFARPPWALTTTASRSGTHAWSSKGKFEGIAVQLDNPLLIDLTAVESATLTFWHRFDFASTTQAAVGVGWIEDGEWQSSVLRDFTGTQLTWQQVKLDLTPFVGRQIGFFFYFPRAAWSNDGAAGAGMAVDGWYIDDVAVFSSDLVANDACSSSVSSTSADFGPDGGSASVEVGVPSGCQWTAESDSPWLKITGGSSGRGPGSVRYTVAANPNSTRTGTLTIAGWTFTVIQVGANDVLFEDDMESGTNGWQWQPFDSWALTTASSRSGTHAWTDSPGGNYQNNQVSALTSPEIDLTAVESATLTFWSRYDFASGDLGQISVSGEDGNGFRLGPHFTGTNLTWQRVSLDLGPFVGERIEIAFVLFSDDSETADGWYIDDVAVYTSDFVTLEPPPPPQARLENPAPTSFQSGIAAISGWACEAQNITIELNGVPYRTGYPTTRPDTQGVCGDTDNGFSLLWNWNNLGAGTHTVRALLDGVEFANTTVRVTTFGEPFRRGLSGTFPIPDFPRPGENKRLRWEESLQNFVIIP